MDKWEYGYLYFCKTIKRDANGRPLFQQAGPNLAVVRRDTEFSIAPYDDSVVVMNSLGAEGWIIHDSLYFDSSAPKRVDTEIEVQGLSAWGYWSHFMRRQAR